MDDHIDDDMDDDIHEDDEDDDDDEDEDEDEDEGEDEDEDEDEGEERHDHDNEGEDMDNETDEEQDGESDIDIDQDQQEEEENYFSALNKLSKKWIATQLTHNVSAEATNTFWKLSMDLLPDMLSLKSRDNITRKTPKFPHQRRKLHKDLCPPVYMKFAFKHKVTGEIVTVDSNSTPAKRFQRNPDYMKLYEEAHVKVHLVHLACQSSISTFSMLV